MKVYVSATLRNFFGRNPSIEISGESIRKVLSNLTDEYPEAKKVLFDETEKFRSFIQIYVGDENHTKEEYWDEELAPNAELLLLPAIAGGAPRESIISDERRKEVLLDDK